MLSMLLVLLLYLTKGVIGQSTVNDATVQCEEGWYQYGDKCFQMGGSYSDRVSWNVARQRCLDLGGDLASIHSSEENEFLSMNLLLTLKTNFWIGIYRDLNNTENSVEYIWSDGSPVDFVNWNEDFNLLTSGEKEENCVQVLFNLSYTGNGRWGRQECSKESYYLCQKTKNTALSNPNLKYCSDSDDPGYSLSPSCYHYVSTLMTWADAEEFCQSTYEGNLVTYTDNTVNMFLNYILKELNVYTPVWIGIKAMGPNQLLKWSSGWFLTYENWIDGFSMDQFKKGNCAVRLRYGPWERRSCEKKLAFVCEVNADPPPILQPTVSGSYCPTEPPVWKDFGGDYCYYYNDEVKVTWPEADLECRINGGTLASIHSWPELRIFEFFFRFNVVSEFFIGLFLKYDDDWAWTDGSKVEIIASQKSTPNSKARRCTLLQTRLALWNDIKCDSRRAYLCSRKKILPNVTLSEENVMCSDELYIIVNDPHG